MLAQIELERIEHPVDLIERIAAHHEWAFDRDEEDEISIGVAGTWTDYNIAFTWLPEIEALHVRCGRQKGLRLKVIQRQQDLFGQLSKSSGVL